MSLRTKTCYLPLCDKVIKNRGKYCAMHDARNRRNGSFELNKISDSERFLKMVVKINECWIWQGHKLRGYGRFRFDGRKYTAHRAAYLLFKGSIKKNLIVCHSCDNPSCVNPEHLWLGTSLDNSHDSVKKGRNFIKKGSKLNMKYSDDEVMVIKDLTKLFPDVVLAKKLGVTVSILQHIKWHR